MNEYILLFSSKKNWNSLRELGLIQDTTKDSPYLSIKDVETRIKDSQHMDGKYYPSNIHWVMQIKSDKMIKEKLPIQYNNMEFLTIWISKSVGLDLTILPLTLKYLRVKSNERSDYNDYMIWFVDGTPMFRKLTTLVFENLSIADGFSDLVRSCLPNVEKLEFHNCHIGSQNWDWIQCKWVFFDKCAISEPIGACGNIQNLVISGREGLELIPSIGGNVICDLKDNEELRNYLEEHKCGITYFTTKDTSYHVVDGKIFEFGEHDSLFMIDDKNIRDIMILEGRGQPIRIYTSSGEYTTDGPLIYNGEILSKCTVEFAGEMLRYFPNTRYLMVTNQVVSFITKLDKQDTLKHKDVIGSENDERDKIVLKIRQQRSHLHQFIMESEKTFSDKLIRINGDQPSKPNPTHQQIQESDSEEDVSESD